MSWRRSLMCVIMCRRWNASCVSFRDFIFILLRTQDDNLPRRCYLHWAGEMESFDVKSPARISELRRGEKWTSGCAPFYHSTRQHNLWKLLFYKWMKLYASVGWRASGKFPFFIAVSLFPAQCTITWSIRNISAAVRCSRRKVRKFFFPFNGCAKKSFAGVSWFIGTPFIKIYQLIMQIVARIACWPFPPSKQKRAQSWECQASEQMSCEVNKFSWRFPLVVLGSRSSEFSASNRISAIRQAAQFMHSTLSLIKTS